MLESAQRGFDSFVLIANPKFARSVIVVECCYSPALFPVAQLGGAVQHGEAGIGKSEGTVANKCRRESHRQMPIVTSKKHLHRACCESP